MGFPSTGERTREERSVIIQDMHRTPPRPLWAYGYELTPPVRRIRMTGIQGVLDEGHSKAALAGRVWEGRFVNGDDVTHILVVCGTPAQDLEVNRKLEAELARLEAAFSVTASLEVVHGPDPPRMN